MGIRAIPQMVGRWLSRHTLEPFAHKPGLHIPADATKLMTVAERKAGRMRLDHFLEKAGEEPKHLITGKALDMVPQVMDGFQPGDIVLRGSSLVSTAQSGAITSLTESIKSRAPRLFKSPISHSGVIVRDADGALKVVHMVTGKPDDLLARHLSRFHKFVKATFARKEGISEFFNIQGNPITRAIVMRPKSKQMADQAAAKALALWQTQVTASSVKPWYSKIPQPLAPRGRGGVCSTFVNLAFDNAFKQPWPLPATPLHFMISPQMRMVADRQVTTIKAVSGPIAEGVSLVKAAATAARKAG